jgi:hypothetical protein
VSAPTTTAVVRFLGMEEVRGSVPLTSPPSLIDERPLGRLSLVGMVGGPLFAADTLCLKRASWPAASGFVRYSRREWSPQRTIRSAKRESRSSCSPVRRAVSGCILRCRWAAPPDRDFGLDAIGTDMNSRHLTGLRPDLPTVMSRFVMPGLPLREVIRLVTSRAAIIVGKADDIASRRPGLAADVTVLRCTNMEFVLRDGAVAVCTMTCLLVP